MKRLLLLLILVAASLHLAAQSRQIKGKVTDDSNVPLEGVTVRIKGSTGGTQTDKDGNFTLNTTSSGKVDLVFSSTGFKETTVSADGSKALSVKLASAASALDDVVVVGYQSKRRRELTSSVSSIGAKDMKDIPINSAAEAITGRLAGVQVTTSEGSPGASAVIRVRGGGSITQDNSPLYIVDGIQVENALSVLSPQDIESIDVLKDASATAIYGARGANGVVIITTKGGKDMKTVINYNGLAGIRQLANKLEVMNPYDFVMYQYERTRGGSTDRDGFLNTYGRWEDLDLYKSVPFVDWQDEMFGRNALMQTHNISVAGGTAATKFNLSLTSNTEEGIMLGSDFDRKLVNFRFDHTVSKKLKVGAVVRYNHTVVNGAGTTNEGSSGTNRLRHSIKFRPILMNGQDLTDYDPDYALQTNANGLSLVNPILLNDAEYRRNPTNVTNLSGYFNYEFNRYLSFRSTFGVDITNTRQNSFNDTITTIARQNANLPTASINTITRNTLNNSNVLTFTMRKSGSKFSDKHDLDVLLGQELYQNTERRYNIETRYFPIGITAQKALGNMGLGSAPAGSVQPLPFSSEVPSRLFSFFGQVNYMFNKRFQLDFTMRADGSSKFASDNRWGYFPSVAAAWRISQERFMDDFSEVISDLKLRASYGRAGNNRIDDFLYLTQFNANVYYGFGDNLVTSYSPAALSNNSLKWETTISRNLGLDIGFLNNRLLLSVDVYSNKTQDLLVNVPVPTSSGYTSQLQNVGSTTNKGVEVQLSGTPMQTRDFRWTANFNISFNKNKIESLGAYQSSYLFSSGWGGSAQPFDYLVRVGQPVGMIWGLQTDGYYTIDDFTYNNGIYTLKPGVPNNSEITATPPQPGMLKFKDLSGAKGKPDSLVDNNDRTIIGNTQPKFFGGLNQQFSYKNFDLSIFLNFQVGNDVYNANKLEFTSGYTVNSNLLASMNDRWKTVDANGQVVTDPAALAALNKDAKLWQPLRSASSFYVHSWAIEDGSFLRVNNITLGYTLPKKLFNKTGISNLRVYATVNNLHVFTNYSGYDPEVSTRRNTPLTPGVDYSAYPRSRSFIFGLNLSL
jgi:TonB-linked SusC/RagA family outer membrane protein